MDNNTLIAVVIIAVVAILAIAFVGLRASQSRRLRSKFGPEYDRAVESEGDQRKAEHQLHERAKRVKAYHIKPLTANDRARFNDAWKRVQADFVDNPKEAVTRADALLTEVMTVRGYPMTDFEQRSADLSVDHPVVVDKYRSAHEIAVRHAEGKADTEDLRKAMIDYRALFAELVSEPEVRAKAS